VKIISYSLWGNRKLYVEGAMANGIDAREIYPGWKTNIAVHKDVNKNTISKLREIFDIVKIYDDDASEYRGLFWRFDAMVYGGMEVCLIRDTDSRLSDKEFQAVQEWLVSDKQIHNMRDNIYHFAPIMGGLWGIKQEGPINIRFFHKILMSHNLGEYGCDQRILGRLYKGIKDQVMSHDDSLRYGSVKFPPHKPLEQGAFIGDCITMDGETNKKYGREKFDKKRK
jgi:hypothetical protein